MTVLEITTYGRNTLRRLRREARIVDPRPVPSLAPAYEVDPSAPHTTLVTEDLPDITLDDLVGISPLPAAAALHALQDVAATLHAMHECGLVHDDLRPQAVFILPDGRAALARRDAAPPPATGTTRDAAWQTDAYGFAVLAFELLTGIHPLDPRDPLAMAMSLTGLPPQAAAVLGQALTADPEERPLPRELVAALDSIPPEEWTTNHLRRGPAAAPPPPPAATAAAAVAPESAPESIEPEPEPGLQLAVRDIPPHTKRSLFRRILGPFVILLGLTTVLAGGGTGAWLLFVPDASAGDPLAKPPHVRKVSISITPPQAQCPHATLHLVATIVTDGGAGEVVVRWRLPDGSTAETQSFSVDAGRSTLRAAIDLTLTGADELVGDIVAVVSPTGVKASAPLRYLCPDVRNAPDRTRKV